MIDPLPLLRPEEAAELRQWLTRQHAADWQERNFEEIRSIVQHPTLGQRAASLLGDEVVAWRSQVFVVDGNHRGTFWHSATTFTEDGDLPALTPPPHIPEPMVNVSCWIALGDVDKENACLRLILGTHSDVRLDTMIRRFSRDRVGFLMSMEPKDRRSAIIALRYSGDIFMAGRLAFGVRITSADVGIYEGQATIPYATGSGNTDVDTTPFRSGVPMHSADGPVGSTI